MNVCSYKLQHLQQIWKLLAAVRWWVVVWGLFSHLQLSSCSSVICYAGAAFVSSGRLFSHGANLNIQKQGDS